MVLEYWNRSFTGITGILMGLEWEPSGIWMHSISEMLMGSCWGLYSRPAQALRSSLSERSSTHDKLPLGSFGSLAADHAPLPLLKNLALQLCEVAADGSEFAHHLFWLCSEWLACSWNALPSAQEASFGWSLSRRSSCAMRSITK